MPHWVKLGHEYPGEAHVVSVPPVDFTIDAVDRVTAVQTSPNPVVVAVPKVEFVHTPQSVNAVQAGGASTYFECDCSTFSDTATLQSVMGTTTPTNVHAEFGVGMRYDFIPRPTHCGDQALASRTFFPNPTLEIWAQWKGRFSSNWTNANPNCGASPQPDYKFVLLWLDNNTRFDFKVGTANSYWDVRPPGSLSQSNTPLTVDQPGRGGNNPYPIAANIWNGSWHTYSAHWKITLGPPARALAQIKVDDIILANYDTGYSSNPFGPGNRIQYIAWGANRNQGNPLDVNMNVWWDDIKLWTSNPNLAVFNSFPALDVY